MADRIVKICQTSVTKTAHREEQNSTDCSQTDSGSEFHHLRRSSLLFLHFPCVIAGIAVPNVSRYQCGARGAAFQCRSREKRPSPDEDLCPTKSAPEV